MTAEEWLKQSHFHEKQTLEGIARIRTGTNLEYLQKHPLLALPLASQVNGVDVFYNDGLTIIDWVNSKYNYVDIECNGNPLGLPEGIEITVPRLEDK